MSYIDVNTLEEVTRFDIMARNPNVSFPNGSWSDEVLDSVGYATLYMPDTHPFPTVYEKLVEGTPKKIKGKWYKTFTVEPLTDEEKTLKTNNELGLVRRKRNELLAISDWTQFNDSPLTVDKKEEWAVYRQVLRDITKCDDIFNPPWPAEPQA